jgi:molybdopterin molybdotransferase
MCPASERQTTDRSWDNLDLLVPVNEALARVLDAVRPLPPVDCELLEALDRVSASPARATEDVPPFTNSAMDGFAVRAADTTGASPAAPVSLAVVGAIAAGEPATERIAPGEAIRIMTGAPVPAGADAVVRFEDTANVNSRVEVHRPVAALENVRLAGEDIRAGEVAVPAGTALSAPWVGMLAALGQVTVTIHRQPRVAILSTGNELVAANGTTGSGRIRDSNSTTLAALVAEAGGLPLALGAVRDEMDDLRAALRRAVDDFRPDLILTSGGVSVGDYDMVKDALRAEGKIAIWQVRMKPGKPLAFGAVNGVPLLGLPGNPVAAAISFLQFGHPAIRRMLGHPDVSLPTVTAVTTAEIANAGQRRHFMRVRLQDGPDGRLSATPAGEQGAGILSSLALADGLLVVPEDLTHVPAGSCLPVQLLRGRG